MLRSEIVRRILEARGIAAAGLDAFLHPSLRDLARPEGLPGLAEAADAVLAAVSAKREVVVFGDYDCDGVCATAILVKTLTALGASVSPFLPTRLSEGYGMSDASVSRMLAEHPGVGFRAGDVLRIELFVNRQRSAEALREFRHVFCKSS